jgi:hypothetical protein
MQSPIVNTSLKPTQKNIFLFFSFFLFSLFICSLHIGAHHPLVLMTNPKSAQEMGITIPDKLKNQAKIIGEKS